MRHMFLLGISAVSLAACVETTTYTTVSANRVVTLINNSNQSVIRFYGSNAGTSSWEEDILGNDVLPAGRSVNINFDDGSGYCEFDFKAEMADGSTRESYGVDVCRVASVTID